MMAKQSKASAGFDLHALTPYLCALPILLVIFYFIGSAMVRHGSRSFDAERWREVGNRVKGDLRCKMVWSLRFSTLSDTLHRDKLVELLGEPEKETQMRLEYLLGDCGSGHPVSFYILLDRKGFYNDNLIEDY